jgi:hypothetical protein
MPHSRPVADRFIQEVEKLRNRSASEDEIRGAGRILYPKVTARDESMRARLMRACRASDANWSIVRRHYDDGANIGAVVAELDRPTATGAPKGNINSRGKKRDFSLTRISGMWRAMTRAQ